jgi:hypothetical protein
MKVKAPTLETAVAIPLGLAGGLFALYLPIALALELSQRTTDIEAAVLAPWIAGVGFLGSALLFVGSIGVLRGRNWGRGASVAGLLILALLDATFLVVGLERDTWLYGLLLLALLGPVALYLFRPFRGPQRTSA